MCILLYRTRENFMAGNRRVLLLLAVNAFLCLTYIGLRHFRKTPTVLEAKRQYEGKSSDGQTRYFGNAETKNFVEHLDVAQKHNSFTSSGVLDEFSMKKNRSEQPNSTEPKTNENNGEDYAESLKFSSTPTETKLLFGQTNTDGQTKSSMITGQRYGLPQPYVPTRDRTKEEPIIRQKKRDQNKNAHDKPSSPYIMNYEESRKCTKYEPPKKGSSKDPRTKLVVYWQDHDSFPERTFSQMCNRPTVGPCELSFDLNLHGKADAIIFHASNIHIEKPPFKKRRGQVWIAKGLESPIHWHPDYKKPAWKGVFNWTFTYRPDSEMFAPVGVLVKNPNAHKADYRKIAQKKTRSVAWFVSDCQTLSKREDYVKKLQKHIDVDIYGECGPLKCDKKHRRSCFDMLTENYRFYLAFENSLCPYYVTEKFFTKFGLNVIPVVRGGFDYKKYIPDGTYINTADFASPKDLAKYLNKLGKDLDAYSAMLERNDQFHHSACLRGESWCKMCDMLHDDSLTPSVYPNLGSWWEQTPCLEEKDVRDIR